uniref:Uncharacterized protein n=1 Tax=Pithovirus LCPAC403 TaxID=2506596 RepID=A0A481ZAT7_9VIRU|nr:MAG: hypothetical protein LCPAC403_00210 [Pithovirus LCPAC403]
MVQAGSAAIEDTREQRVSLVKDYNNGVSSGKFRTQSLSLDVAAASTGSIITSWPYPVRIYSTDIVSFVGDIVSIYIGQSTNVGLLTANAGIGSIIITVEQSVIDDIFVGAEVELNEGATTDDLGVVLSIDAEGLTITCSIATVNSFTTSASVLMTTVICKDVEIADPKMTIGRSLLGSTLIPSGVQIKLEYQNISAAARHVVCYLELIY